MNGFKIKTLLKQNTAVEVVFRANDKDNRHYQIKGANTDIFYHHHLGRYQGDKRNPDWERVTICVYRQLTKEEKMLEWDQKCRLATNLGTYQFDGIGCVGQADKKLKELMK
tara:strand:- start:1714 stop:2046 length:333 start_codon:yes stop_codon:yes gene_type:complete